MDTNTILATMRFGRARLLAILDTIEKSGQDVAKVLAWRPAKNRAHIAWQAMHCAATHDRYLHVYLLNTIVQDEALCASYAGGTTPADTNIPTLAEIRRTLEKHNANVEAYVNGLTPADLERVYKLPNGTQRSVGESLILLAWHEAHHQGQIHLTWNLYQVAHGLK